MIVLKNVSLLRGTKPVLNQASATLHPGEKVGLIGRNGAGKSSLFSLLAGRLQPDAGDVEIPPSWLQPGGMAEVAQNMPETDDPATEYVLQGDTRLMKALEDLAAAEEADDGNAIGEAHATLAEVAARQDRLPALTVLVVGDAATVRRCPDDLASGHSCLVWRGNGVVVANRSIVLFVGFFVLLYVLVFVIVQGRTGASPGKLLLGVRVVDEPDVSIKIGGRIVRRHEQLFGSQTA